MCERDLSALEIAKGLRGIGGADVTLGKVGKVLHLRAVAKVSAIGVSGAVAQTRMVASIKASRGLFSCSNVATRFDLREERYGRVAGPP